MWRIFALGALTLTPWSLFACGHEAQEPKAQEPKAQAKTVVRSGAAVFAAACAPCHGVTGDGQGVVQLDRPARSFKEGGFSFGNTPEALFRTISAGIGGTPMPGFAASLPEAERHAVAEYVISLGPETVPDAGAASILVVGDRPVVVRGQFKSLAPGLAATTRGLLIGTLEGLSWQYRADDVRLLAVRQGAFVNRTDWGGRGGTPLEPLGKVAYLPEHGAPAATFASADGTPLLARLRATRIEGERAWLRYKLAASAAFDDPGVAIVQESAAAASLPSVAGYRRTFVVGLSSAGRRPELLLHLAQGVGHEPAVEADQGAVPEPITQANQITGPDGTTWLRLPAQDPNLVMGLNLHLIPIEGQAGPRVAVELQSNRQGMQLRIPEGDAMLQVEWTTLPLPDHKESTWQQLKQEIQS